MNTGKKKGRKSYALFFLVFFLVVLETASRIGFSRVFSIPFFHPERIYLNFYPELDQLKDYKYDSDRINLLVLGGSVVTGDTIQVEWQNEIVTSMFCGMEDYLDPKDYNVLNLAKAGHNSMDSRIKFDLAGHRKFDYVFVYHGINDTRTNNISRDMFDNQYRHIEFYDDLMIVRKHPEMKITTMPFMVSWLIHSVKKKHKQYIPKEFFFGLLFGEPEPYLKEGADVKSDVVFRSNYEHLIGLAHKRQIAFILSTYAWYLPDDYTYDRFRNKELDYDQQIWQTELYGLPANVRKGLIRHNEVIRELHEEHQDLCYIDMEGIVEKGKKNFNDVCHLNSSGCGIMANELAGCMKPDGSD